jgi:hypothetical protein
VEGSNFIQVNNFSGDRTVLPDLVSLTQSKLAELAPDSSLVPAGDVWAGLPAERRVAGSELLVRGPYALQPITTLGPDDILQLGGEIFALVADYTDSLGQVYTRIVVPYPTRESAQAAYTHLLENLDPYIKVIDRQEHRFQFQDWQQKYGSAALRDCRLEIVVNSAEPASP